MRTGICIVLFLGTWECDFNFDDLSLSCFQFFIHNSSTSKSNSEKSKTSTPIEPRQCPSTSQIISMEHSTSKKGSNSRKNSLDLYEEAATILGLTCSQTDSCKCIECQVNSLVYRFVCSWGTYFANRFIAAPQVPLNCKTGGKIYRFLVS